MPFGFTGSPATFCRLVNSLFGPKDQPQVSAYLDDILIVTETFNEHLRWLEYVLNKLVDAGMKVNRDNCEFSCSRVLKIKTFIKYDGLFREYKLSQLGKLSLMGR